MASDLRDKIANFDDQFRPLRNYFYWEPHCFDIPVCAAIRSVLDALDAASLERKRPITLPLLREVLLTPELMTQPTPARKDHHAPRSI